MFVGNVVEGDPGAIGHIIQTSSSGPSRQVISYKTERVVGNGSFGVVFQAACIENGDTVRPPMLHVFCSCVQGAVWGQLGMEDCSAFTTAPLIGVRPAYILANNGQNPLLGCLFEMLGTARYMLYLEMQLEHYLRV